VRNAYVPKRSERETIISIAEDQHTWHVYSEIPRHISKLTKRWGPGTETSPGCFVWNIPEKLISFRAPSTLSDDQRKARAERLKKAREAKGHG
jgi:hypothetical protein